MITVIRLGWHGHHQKSRFRLSISNRLEQPSEEAGRGNEITVTRLDGMAINKRVDFDCQSVGQIA